MAQEDPPIGRELIRVSHDDGRIEELRLHEYERLYALPGVYEEIVQDRLECRSPREIAGMLADAVDRAGTDRRQIRVLDIAAGNGVSGQALAELRLRPVLGTDIVPGAERAALRDRPGLYDAYLTLDLLSLSDQERGAVQALRPNALTCVAPVGPGLGELPPAALAAAVELLEPEALIAYMVDPGVGDAEAIGSEFWAEHLGLGTRSQRLEQRRYVHRRTVNGAPFEMVGVLWRVTRPG